MISANRIYIISVILIICLFLSSLANAQGEVISNIEVCIDPRVELISIISRLAGYEEYNKGRIKTYIQDVEKHFGKFRHHPTVQFAIKLRKTRGISYNAPMSLAVCLTHDFEWDNRIRFTSLDERWIKDEALIFIEKMKNFAVESNFKDFLKAQEQLHHKMELNAFDLIQKNFHVDWFNKMFGPRPNTIFKVIISLLNAPAFYGAGITINDKEEFYCFLGAWNENLDGFLKYFYMGFIAHEFCHLYVNPLVDSHASQFEKSGKCIFSHVKEKMEQHAYGQWKTMLAESIVRALEAHYRKDTGSLHEKQFEIKRSENVGFLWLSDLHNLIDEYKKHRDIYPAFDSFIPKIIEFFNTYCNKLEKH